MKKLKKITAVLLATAIFVCSFALQAFAQERTFEIKMINYNVAGLPRFDGVSVSDNQLKIAKYIVENGYDVVAVQEDFGSHKSLKKGLIGYEFSTNHTGGVPGGDGLNIFTKNMTIYNEERQQWLKAYGDIAEGDILTPKGLIHTVIDAGNGVYIDFYNIHADAFDTQGSREARESNFNQVADLICENHKKYNRPVIITGDFNTFYHATTEENSNIYAIFQERCGLTDAWIELENNGDYFDFSNYNFEESYWGEWDSVERFMYKSGGGVEIEAVDFEYVWILDDEGVSLSDHAAAECTIKITLTEDFTERDFELKEVKQPFYRNFLNTVSWIIKDLIYVFLNLDEMAEMLS